MLAGERTISILFGVAVRDQFERSYSRNITQRQGLRKRRSYKLLATGS